MSTRALFLGMLAIVVAGGIAWYILRPDVGEVGPPSADEPAAAAPDPRLYGGTADTGRRVERPRAPSGRRILGAGEEAPDFELETLVSGSFRLTEHRGRLIVLNFWATWCEPCRDEMPDLVRVRDSLAHAGVLVAGISIDEEGRDVVEPFHETFPVDYPLLLNGLEVARAYGAHYVVPTTFVVDRTGRIAERFDGAVTIETLLPRLRAHLQQVE